MKFINLLTSSILNPIGICLLFLCTYAFNANIVASTPKLKGKNITSVYTVGCGEVYAGTKNSGLYYYRRGWANPAVYTKEGNQLNSNYVNDVCESWNHYPSIYVATQAGISMSFNWNHAQFPPWQGSWIKPAQQFFRENSATSIYVFPRKIMPDIVFAVGGDKRLYYSCDSGKEWNFTSGTSSPVNSISGVRFSDPVWDYLYVYAGTGNGLYMVNYTDKGHATTWSPITALNNMLGDDKNINSVAAFGISFHAIIYAATNNGVYSSQDNGATWQHKLAGIKINKVSTPPGSNGQVYAITDDNDLYFSQDYGENWDPVYTIENGLQCSINAANGSLVYTDPKTKAKSQAAYVGTSNGLYESTIVPCGKEAIVDVPENTNSICVDKDNGYVYRGASNVNGTLGGIYARKHDDFSGPGHYYDTAAPVYCLDMYNGYLYAGIKQSKINVYKIAIDGTLNSVQAVSLKSPVYSLCISNGYLYASGGGDTTTADISVYKTSPEGKLTPTDSFSVAKKPPFSWLCVSHGFLFAGYLDNAAGGIYIFRCEQGKIVEIPQGSPFIFNNKTYSLALPSNGYLYAIQEVASLAGISAFKINEQTGEIGQRHSTEAKDVTAADKLYAKNGCLYDIGQNKITIYACNNDGVLQKLRTIHMTDALLRGNALACSALGLDGALYLGTKANTGTSSRLGCVNVRSLHFFTYPSGDIANVNKAESESL